jgi:hypothetical protein
MRHLAGSSHLAIGVILVRGVTRRSSSEEKVTSQLQKKTKHVRLKESREGTVP